MGEGIAYITPASGSLKITKYRSIQKKAISECLDSIVHFAVYHLTGHIVKFSSMKCLRKKQKVRNLFPQNLAGQMYERKGRAYLPDTQKKRLDIQYGQVVTTPKTPGSLMCPNNPINST